VTLLSPTGIRYDERLEKDMIAVPIGPRLLPAPLRAFVDFIKSSADHP
jgi:hypothetical protein